MKFVLLLWFVFCIGGASGLWGQNNMISVPAGTFMMGDGSGTGKADELPTRQVTLSPFQIGRYEVTFLEYDAYCEAVWTEKPEDNGWGRGMRPVINVSWYDAVLYCNWRSLKEGLTPCYLIDKLRPDTSNKSVQDLDRWEVKCNFHANGYRLPTEAEWEYAARSARAESFIPPVGVDSVAWYISNAKVMTRSVGQKSPNELGIFDLCGNVAEWCWDWYDTSYEHQSNENPHGADSGEYRVVRGGSWEDQPHQLRITGRNALSPHLKNLRNVGFRLVRKMN